MEPMSNQEWWMWTGLYLLPTLIAIARGHRNKVPILVINLFLAWTIIGWIFVFAWSFSSNTRHRSEAVK